MVNVPQFTLQFTSISQNCWTNPNVWRIQLFILDGQDHHFWEGFQWQNWLTSGSIYSTTVCILRFYTPWFPEDFPPPVIQPPAARPSRRTPSPCWPRQVLRGPEPRGPWGLYHVFRESHIYGDIYGYIYHIYHIHSLSKFKAVYIYNIIYYDIYIYIICCTYTD